MMKGADTSKKFDKLPLVLNGSADIQLSPHIHPPSHPSLPIICIYIYISEKGSDSQNNLYVKQKEDSGGLLETEFDVAN